MKKYSKFILFFVGVVFIITSFLIIKELKKKNDQLKEFNKQIITLSLEECPIPRQKGNTKLFSQYYEDYVLKFIFSSVQKGIYIDVGASHPDIDSVTKYFYLRGWRGINIEPIPNNYNLFLLERPEDLNLNIGISNKEEELVFYRIHPKNSNIDGFSTFDKKIRDKAVQDGYIAEESKIKVYTLNHILEKYPLAHIDFIKIDVEGFEKLVLESLNLKKYRPSIFIVEATEPRSMIPSHQTWEPILLENNYIFILFDGINRYYVAKEHLHKFYDKFKEVSKCISLINTFYKITGAPILFNQESKKSLREPV